MKNFILGLLCLIGVTASAAVPEYIRNSFDTNADPAARNVVTQIVNSMIGTGAVTSVTVTNTAVYILTNSPIVPRSEVMNFASITNGYPPGQPFTNGNNKLWYPLFSAIGASNLSKVVDGAFQMDTRTSSNLSVYLAHTSSIPVRKVLLNYAFSNVNPAGAVSPQFVMLISSNSLGGIGQSLSLTYGLHIVSDATKIDIQEINLGIGSSLGYVSWNGSPSNPADNLMRGLSIELDQPNGIVTIVGNNIRGSVTNELFKSLIPNGTNTAYVGWQIYAAGTTNLTHLVKFYNLGLENFAASEDRVMDFANEGYADLKKNNLFYGATYMASFLGVTNNILTWGASSGMTFGERDLAGQWTAYADADIFRLYNGADLFYFNSTGALGIGISAPASKLHVVGEIKADSLSLTSPPSTAIQGIYIGAQTNTSGGMLIAPNPQQSFNFTNILQGTNFTAGQVLKIAAVSGGYVYWGNGTDSTGAGFPLSANGNAAGFSITNLTAVTFGGVYEGGSTGHPEFYQDGAQTMRLSASLVPFLGSTYDIGSTSLRYNNGYFNNINFLTSTVGAMTASNYLYTLSQVNVATNANGNSNLLITATGPGMVEYWLTNHFTLTNFTGFAGTSGSRLLKFHQAGMNRTNLFALGKQFGVNITTNANSPLWQTYTQGMGYNVGLTWFGTNIDVAVTAFSE